MTAELGADSKSVGSTAGSDAPRNDPDGGDEQVVFLMAACQDPTKRPERSEFVPVEPRDLSATSISFYCDDAPKSDSIVLLMGKVDDDPIYVTAVVTTRDEGFWERKRRYLVGCQLTGRL